MVKKISKVLGEDHFMPKLQFVFVRDGNHTSKDKETQIHAQRERCRRRRWNANRECQEMRRRAEDSFRKSFSATGFLQPEYRIQKSEDNHPLDRFPAIIRTRISTVDQPLESVETDMGRCPLRRRISYPGGSAQDDKQQAVIYTPQTMLGAGRSNPFRTYAIDIPNIDWYIDVCKFAFSRGSMTFVWHD